MLFLLYSITLNAQVVELQNKPVCIDDFNNIADLDSIFNSSRIVLLGEAGHGDGATFELKSRLIEYLYKKHGYTFLLSEASGFTESVRMNFDNAMALQIFKKTADTKFSSSAQYNGFKRFLSDNPSFKYYGIDCQPVRINLFLDEMNVVLKQTSNQLAKMYLKDIISYYEQSTSIKEFTLTLEDLNKLDSATIHYMKNLQVFNHPNASYIKQLLLNVRAALHIAIHNIEEMSYSYKSINWRDSVMASNIEWIMARFPNEKIIISAANFHNAKNMGNLYHNEDSTYYSLIRPVGSYISNKMGKSAYSLAITSTSGMMGYCTDTVVYNIEEVAKFKIDENVLESHLLIPNCEIAFFDFRKDKTLETQVYRSLIFGTNMHRGKWSTAFDGIINIRIQKVSTSTKNE